jgi:hypothetical protein
MADLARGDTVEWGRGDATAGVCGGRDLSSDPTELNVGHGVAAELRLLVADVGYAVAEGRPAQRAGAGDELHGGILDGAVGGGRRRVGAGVRRTDGFAGWAGGGGQVVFARGAVGLQVGAVEVHQDSGAPVVGAGALHAEVGGLAVDLCRGVDGSFRSWVDGGVG